MCLSLGSCCCCISLEVGAQIISIVSTILSTTILTLYSSAVILLSLPMSKMVFYAAVSVISGCQSVFGCLLSYGVFQKKPKLMWPWLILTWTLSLILIVLSVVGTAVLVYRGQFQESAEVNSMVTFYSIYSLLHLYFASVVNSRRAEIVREDSYKSVSQLRTVNSWKYV